MSDLQTLLERNDRFSAAYEGGLSISPRFSTFILTCADSRIDPAHFLGLELGDALVFRNAGGRVTHDTELEIGILWRMGKKLTGENFSGFSLALVQHTDCGFERLANPEVAGGLSKGMGIERAHIDSLANHDHARRLREDIERLRNSALVPNELVVSAHIYHVEDGTIQEVVAPAPLSARS